MAVLGFGIMFGFGMISLRSDFDHSFVHAQDDIFSETLAVESEVPVATDSGITATSGAVTAVPEETHSPTSAPEETEVLDGTMESTEAPVKPICMFVLDPQGGMIFGANTEDEILFYRKNIKGNTIITVSPIKAQRKGYLFKGWYTQPTDGTKVTSLKITTDTTLYARWAKVKVKKAKISKLKNKPGKKAAVKIKKISGAKGYQVVYSTKRSFKNAKKKNTTKRTVTLKRLKKKKTYYIKVRAYKKDSAGKKVYGSYSAAKKVKIKK